MAEVPFFDFHPLISGWFQKRYGKPTDIQQLSWPVIGEGHHVLISAPTGSGKTLTAFLSAINALVTGRLETGGLRILYISPLKALNNDIQRNLTSPLEELRQAFQSAGESFPEIRVAVRSGDTPSDERRSMLRHPPEILITTPESLNILLTSQSGRRIFEGLSVIILDEIHAVASSRRGVHLMTAVERLERICSGFQRIALSATVRPLQRVAAFVGGYQRSGSGHQATYSPRAVELLESNTPGHYELEVDFPVAALAEKGAAGDGRSGSHSDTGSAPRIPAQPTEALYSSHKIEEPPENQASMRSEWPEDVLFGSIIRRLKGVIKSNRSTLIFANSRRMAEKISMLLNEGEEEILAYCHHGALSREIRSVVEQNLKEGRLPAVVATASLELGIDVGDLDQVVLLESPGLLSTTLQRLGRAGHSVGELSRGLFLPLHGRDLLQSAVLSQSVESRQIEEIHPVQGALDLLSQIILSMVCSEEWEKDELLSFLRTSYSYHDLPENQYDSVLEMLSGRFATSRIRELRPRIHVDPVKNTIRAAKGADFLIYMNGGTIPDRGYYALRHLDTKSRIGELDEEFVWERSIGDVFTLGNQSWRVMEINHNDVLVRPAPPESAAMAPFWRADARDRDAFVSEKLSTFLEARNDSLQEQSFCEELMQQYHLTAPAARYLQSFLMLQKERTASDLPHRHHLLIEHYEDPMNRTDRKMVVLHTLWGGQVNRPYSLALRGAFLQEFDMNLQTMSDDDCIMVILPHEFDHRTLLDLVRPDNLESRLKAVLASTGFFGALFRQSAGIAMLLPGKGFRNRTPLWLNRLRSKKLLDATAGFANFPITLEAWRSTLTDAFDLKTLNSHLSEIESGSIRITEAFTRSPSPFARNLIWQQTNTYMYQDDRPGNARPGKPGEDFFKDLARSAGLRPSVPLAVIQMYRGRMMRNASGYELDDVHTLVELIRDRCLISAPELLSYLDALAASQDRQTNPGGETEQHASDAGSETIGGMGKRTGDESFDLLLRNLVCIRWNGSPIRVCAISNVPLLEFALPSHALQVLPLQAAFSGESGSAKETDVAPELREDIEGALHRLRISLQTRWQNSQNSPEPEDVLADLLQSFMGFWGPLGLDSILEFFPDGEAVQRVLQRQIEEGRFVQDQITEPAGDSSTSAGSLEFCDTETLEILLRLTRNHYRPDFQALPLEYLPHFLARFQGLTHRGQDEDDLKRRMEQLIGYPLKASLWESEILPARLQPYFPVWLDSLAEFGLFWLGCGEETVTFLMDRDLPLLRKAFHLAEPERKDEKGGQDSNEATGFIGRWDGKGEESQTLDQLFPHARGRFSFYDLLAESGESAGWLTEQLWKLSWQGLVGNDSVASLRKGIDQKFKGPAGGADHSRQLSRARWAGSLASTGNWRRIPWMEESRSSISRIQDEERNRERVQILLSRYGILFRDLLMRELPPFQWKSVVETLRRMELAGEVIGGHFFDGIPSLQFMSPSSFRELNAAYGPSRTDPLQNVSQEGAIYWINAMDPASLCGLSLEGLPDLPRRIASNHIVYHGHRPVLLSLRKGKELKIMVGEDANDLPEYLGLFSEMLGRSREPLSRVEVEIINEKPALESPYAQALLDYGFYSGGSHLILRKKY
ncbi:MAG: DEAD/DEAH box helicase [Leptospiraceae bacterium]|nr:DEAD/DEAH box helicase [Leptospiraceae bacterium]